MNQFIIDLFCFLGIFQKSQLGLIFRTGGSITLVKRQYFIPKLAETIFWGRQYMFDFEVWCKLYNPILWILSGWCICWKLLSHLVTIFIEFVCSTSNFGLQCGCSKSTEVESLLFLSFWYRYCLCERKGTWWMETWGQHSLPYRLKLFPTWFLRLRIIGL